MLRLYQLKPIDCHVTWLADDQPNKDYGKRLSYPLELGDLESNDDASKPPPDTLSPQNMLNSLNDDCLHTIFEDPKLDMWDLVELSAVCQRFAHITKRIFPIKFKTTANQFERYGYGSGTLQQLDAFFSNFGVFVESIDLRLFPHENVVAGFIGEYCEKLDELQMTYLESQTMCQLRPMVNRLRKFTIYCKDDDLGDYFGENSRLERFEIFSSLDHLTLPHNQLSNLIDFRVNEILFGDLEMVERFFAANQQLRELHIQQSLIEFGMEHILRHLPHLEQLILNDNDYPDENTPELITIFGHLNCLRTLCIRNESLPIDAILYQLHLGNVQLECLILKDIDNGHYLIDTISRIESIQCLDIGGYPCEINDAHLIRLTERLHHLKEIKIISNRITLSGIQYVLQSGQFIQTAGFVIDRWMGDSIIIQAEECDSIAAICKKRAIELKVVIQAESQRISVSGLW